MFNILKKRNGNRRYTSYGNDNIDKVKLKLISRKLRHLHMCLVDRIKRSSENSDAHTATSVQQLYSRIKKVASILPTTM